MKPLVLKFGGSSLSDCEKILGVAEKIKNIKKNHKGNIACVLSAPADITDDLLKLASKFRPKSSHSDFLISLGEQLSVALMAMALNTLKIKSRPLNSLQLPILSEGMHANAEIKHINPKKINEAFSLGEIALITGFQAVNKNKELQTLGRGGSDLSAVCVGKAIKAEKCFLFSDVKGVYSANPSAVPSAFKIKKLSSDELVALAETGNEVRQLKAIKYAKKNKIDIYFCASLSEEEGTLISWKQDNTAKISLINAKKDKVWLIGVQPHLIKDFDKKISRLKNLLKIKKSKNICELTMKNDLTSENMKKAHKIFLEDDTA